ncbi:MAG: hypothetical protein KC492_44545 [Myxococcales bacterium]|nr:hypothetical protein [Myxococcales bacterium]
MKTTEHDLTEEQLAVWALEMLQALDTAESPRLRSRLALGWLARVYNAGGRDTMARAITTLRRLNEGLDGSHVEGYWTQG